MTRRFGKRRVIGDLNRADGSFRPALPPATVEDRIDSCTIIQANFLLETAIRFGVVASDFIDLTLRLSKAVVIGRQPGP
jgi:hypothetical protein